MTSGFVVVVPSYDAQANLSAVIPPTVNDDDTKGYQSGSLWIDVVGGTAYICVDATTGAAIWNSFGDIPIGGLLYKGAWNANTNDPTLGDNGAGGVKGDYYVVSVAGTISIDGISDWQVLDWIVNNGTIWEKVDNTQAAHDMGGSFHVADTLTNLNTKVSDATLVDQEHGHTGTVGEGSLLNRPGSLNTVGYGTVTVLIGTPDVVGVGSYFETEFSTGQQIKIAGEIFRILVVVDNTHLTLDANHTAGAAGVPYYKEDENTVHGTDVLRNNSTATGCSAFGFGALREVSTSGVHCAFGYRALEKMTIGWTCCAFGAHALRNATGNDNCAFGTYALSSVISGIKNVAMGVNVLYANTGSYSACVGHRAAQSITTGHTITAFGHLAGADLANGTDPNETTYESVYIGDETRASADGVSNENVFGHGAIGVGSNSVVLGNDSVTKTVLKGQIGLGTLSPTAMVHIKGILNDALTGTVSVTINTPNVVGVGTAFDTELQVDDAIKIADEVFTVSAIADATHLTLDSDHLAGAAGVTAYRDPDLFKIQTGDDASPFVVTKNGSVYLSRDVYFANTTHYLGSLVVGSNIKIYASTAVGSIQLRNTVQTPDAPMLLTGSLANHWIVCEAADEATDFGHAQQTNPTVFIHSADATDITQWLSLTHDQTNGVIQTGKGNLTIGSGATSHSLTTPNDLMVSGQLEVDGAVHFDAYVSHYSSPVYYGINYYGGGGVNDTASRISSTFDQFVWGLGSNHGRQVIFADRSGDANDFDHATQTNPTVFVHSATDPDSDNTQWISQAHDQTDAVAESGKGDYLIKTPAQKTLRLGTVVWDDLRVPLTRGALGVGNPPTFAQFMDNGAGSVGVYAYSFAYQAVAGNEEQLFFEVQLPHDYKEGTDIKAHLHWSPAVSGAAGEFVKWGLEYTWINIDGTFGATTIVTSDASSAVTATTSGDGTMVADKHYQTDIATITGTSKLISSMLVCRLFRNSSHADDDLAQAAFGIEFDFHYQIDTMGSRQENNIK